MKVTLHKPSGQYRKMVGGELFYLGTEEKRAKTRAGFIVSLYLQGGKQWLPPYLLQAKQVAAGVPLMVAKAQADTEPERASVAVVAEPDPFQDLTLSDVLSLYREHVEDSVQWQAKGQQHKTNELSRIKGCATILEKFGSVKVAKLDKKILPEMTYHIAGRPTDFSVDYSIHLINVLNRALNWLDHESDIPWNKPSGFEQAFTSAKSSIRLRTEDRVRIVRDKTMPLELLKKIWDETKNDQRKLYYLLGLNCGFAQGELSSLSIGEINLGAKNYPYIERLRKKTLVQGKWKLWPETAKLLKTHLEARGTKEATAKVFQTKNGNNLVWINENGSRIDTVINAWRRWTSNITLPDGISFKSFRKTGSQWVRDLGGQEMSELYLSHTDKTTGKHYNKGDAEKLAAILDEARNKYLLKTI